MRKTLLKSLLVATAMVAGATNVWAEAGDVTTNASIDFSNSAVDGVVAGSVNSITLGGSNTAVSNERLILGNGTNTVTIPEEEYAGKKDVVTITFDLGFGKLTGKEVFFNAKDADGSTIFDVSYNVYSNTFSANTLDVSGDDFYHGYNTVIWDRRASFTITIDYAKQTISTSIYNNYTQATKSHSVALTNTNPVVTFNVGSNYNNDGRRCEFDNLTIATTEGDYTTATANYTVKYVCEGVDVKDADTRTGDVGASIALFASDMANFNSDDETKRYIYVSDDSEGKTISEDGSTIVTVTFREAAKYAYTINSVYNEQLLDFSLSGSVWEDNNTVTVNYPRFQAYNTKTLVERKPDGNDLKKTFTITEDNAVESLEYAATGIEDLYLLSEAEDLDTGLPTNATAFADRVSNRAIVYAASGNLVTLPAGKYVFMLGVIGGESTKHEVKYEVSAGETKIIEVTCTSNTLNQATSEEFELTENTVISFTCSDPASSRGIDLIYIRDLTETISIKPVNSFATYCVPRDLDFTGVEGLTAYIAPEGIAEGKIVLTEAKQVKGGQGMVLAGTANQTYSVPVTTGVAAPATNYLVGVTEDKDMSDVEAYILATDGMFHPVDGGTLKAGKAYLNIAPTAANSISVVFGDEATGIETVKSETVLNGDIFNLRGQRVAAPHKGLYIMQGKKVVVK